jgi:hypothetical protein
MTRGFTAEAQEYTEGREGFIKCFSYLCALRASVVRVRVLLHQSLREPRGGNEKRRLPSASLRTADVAEARKIRIA